MNKQLNDILQRRMDRKDFLKHVGMGMVVLTGLAGVVKLLRPQEQEQAKSSSGASIAGGYGASVYGGGSQLPSARI